MLHGHDFLKRTFIFLPCMHQIILRKNYYGMRLIIIQHKYQYLNWIKKSKESIFKMKHFRNQENTSRTTNIQFHFLIRLINHFRRLTYSKIVQYICVSKKIMFRAKTHWASFSHKKQFFSL